MCSSACCVDGPPVCRVDISADLIMPLIVCMLAIGELAGMAIPIGPLFWICTLNLLRLGSVVTSSILTPICRNTLTDVIKEG